MELLRNVPALAGVALIVGIGLMETGNWPESWWRPFIVREVTNLELGYEDPDTKTHQVITKLCAREEAGWSARSRSEAIRDMQEDDIRYVVKCLKGDGSATPARVISYVRNGKVWLKTEPDLEMCNNLAELERGCAGGT